MKLTTLILLLLSLEAMAQKFKVRAREHVETNRIFADGTETVYKGLTNTINFWWEKPYDISYGFSLQPVLANIRTNDSGTYLGERVTLINIGFELKYFPKVLSANLYARPGIAFSRLSSDNVRNLDGHSYYLGVGYEYPFEQLGVAVEMAYRYSKLSQDVEINSITPSIGFHMYKNF